MSLAVCPYLFPQDYVFMTYGKRRKSGKLLKSGRSAREIGQESCFYEHDNDEMGIGSAGKEQAGNRGNVSIRKQYQREPRSEVVSVVFV
ncbi:hypothetical protein BT69DRAFT_741323 [Atractiella rhizophila]|nr:hypothetical protein BT69DRAFT_741323 [Atractiella rhizophila]